MSTDDQHLGLDAQREAIESWAQREGVTIITWKEEHASGGAELDARHGLQAAVAALREHNAGVLAVAKRDRMARDIGKAQEIAGEDGLVQAAGAVVRSADGMSDAKGPEGVLTMGMVDVVAAYERALIRARTKAAMDVKRRRGEAIGPPPYGYKVGRDGTRLVPHQGEQAVIARVVGLYDAGASERRVVALLMADGVVSRVGTPLSQTQVHRILARGRAVGAGAAFERPVRPLGIVVDVKLSEVLGGYPGVAGQEGENPVQWVADAIREDRVALDVVSLKDALKPGWSDRLRACRDRLGQRAYDRLRAFGMVYVEDTGDRVAVECGTVRESKVRSAMQEGRPVMVIPYGMGCRVRTQADTALLCGVRELPGDDVGTLKLMGRIVLGYTFTPVSVPANDGGSR